MNQLVNIYNGVVGDIIKEEQDTIIKNQIEIKKIGGAINNKARIYWFNYLNKQI